MSEIQETAEQRRAPAQEAGAYGYYAVLLVVYQALYGTFLWFYHRKKGSLEQITPLDLTMLGLATLRISKVISEDEITSVVRGPLVEQTGNDRRPKGAGLRWALGQLVLCPLCTGTWVAAFLTYGLHLFPRHTRPLLAIMSASGLEQFSDALLSLTYAERNVKREQEGS